MTAGTLSSSPTMTANWKAESGDKWTVQEPQPREIVLVERGKIGAQHADAALGRALQSGNHHEQRRFDRAGAPDHGHRIG